MADETENEDITEQVTSDLKKSRDHSRQWRSDAAEDFGFVDGKSQWSEEEREFLRDSLRPEVTFNRVGPVIDVICGEEIANRQEVRYIPRSQGDAKANEVYTAAASWVRDMCDAEDEESDAFRDAVICGMGWTETRMDYEDDLEGMAVIERIDPLEMYWDHTAKKQNLSDARWFARVKKFHKDEVAKMWPDKADDITGGNDLWGEDDDGGTPHRTYAGDQYQYGDGEGSEQSDADLIEVVEYQYYDFEDVYRIQVPPAIQQRLAMVGMNVQANEIVSPKLHDRIKEKADEFGIEFKSVKQKRKRYMHVFMAGELELEHAPIKCKAFKFKPITGRRDRNDNTWYGFVRAMKDPQRWANKWLSQVMHIINSNAKGGLMAEKDAFDNPRKAEEEWADPQSITFLKPGGLSKVMPKSPITYPAGLDKLMEFAVSSIRDVSGVSVEMLGMREGNQPGILEYQRKQAGLRILATMFNALRRYRKEQGRLLLSFIEEYLTDGRLIRIVGEEGAKYIPLTKQEGTTTYDVIVDDAPTSPNQKDKVFSILSTLVPQLVAAGIPVPPDVVDYMPLPEDLIEKWKAMLVQQQDAGVSQEEAAMMQANMEYLQAENQKLRADAEGKMMKAQLDAQLKREEIQARMQEETLTLAQKRDLAMQELELKRQIAEYELTLEQMKMQAQAELKEREQLSKEALEQQKIDLDRQDRQASHQPQVYVVQSGKKRVSVQRDADGNLIGAEVSEE
jgi:hypothetical protein